MHPYRVKEYMWVLIVIMFIVIACLTGCSSAPTVQSMAPQYCHTSQTIQTRNGDKVNSETTVDCTDDQVKRLTQNRLGIAANCGEFVYHMKIGDRYVQRKGISCQKPNGTWEVVNTSGI